MELFRNCDVINDENYAIWTDVWNAWYIELRIWNQVSYDHRSYELQFKQLHLEAWKSQDFNGVWTRDLAIPVRRSNQLSYEATDTDTVSRGHGFRLVYAIA